MNAGVDARHMVLKELRGENTSQIWKKFYDLEPYGFRRLGPIFRRGSGYRLVVGRKLYQRGVRFTPGGGA